MTWSVHVHVHIETHSPNVLHTPLILRARVSISVGNRITIRTNDKRDFTRCSNIQLFNARLVKFAALPVASKNNNNLSLFVRTRALLSRWNSRLNGEQKGGEISRARENRVDAPRHKTLFRGSRWSSVVQRDEIIIDWYWYSKATEQWSTSTQFFRIILWCLVISQVRVKSKMINLNFCNNHLLVVHVYLQ